MHHKNKNFIQTYQSFNFLLNSKDCFLDFLQSSPSFFFFFFIFSPSFFTSSPPFLCKFILTYSLIACQIFGIKFALRSAAHRVVNLPNSTANPSRPRRHCQCQCHRIPRGPLLHFCSLPLPLPHAPRLSPSASIPPSPPSVAAVQKCFQSCRR